MSGLFSRAAEAMKKNKKLSFIVYAALIALGILPFLSAMRDGEKGGVSQAESAASLADEEQRTEQRLSAILSNIRGAGRVDVMILYDTGAQLVPAMDIDSQSTSAQTTGSGGETASNSRTESQKPVTAANSSTGTIVLAEKQPEIRGVIVIAEGAADISVRVDLQRAAQTVLGIDASLVEVFIMDVKEEGMDEKGW